MGGNVLYLGLKGKIVEKLKRFLIEGKLNAILQLEDNSKNLKYALILDEKKSGVVYGYEGKGIYSFELLLNGKPMDDYDEDSDWNDILRVWCKESGTDIKYSPDAMIDIIFELGEYLGNGAILLRHNVIQSFNGEQIIKFGKIEPIDYEKTCF